MVDAMGRIFLPDMSEYVMVRTPPIRMNQVLLGKTCKHLTPSKNNHRTS